MHTIKENSTSHLLFSFIQHMYNICTHKSFLLYSSFFKQRKTLEKRESIFAKNVYIIILSYYTAFALNALSVLIFLLNAESGMWSKLKTRACWPQPANSGDGWLKREVWCLDQQPPDNHWQLGHDRDEHNTHYLGDQTESRSLTHAGTEANYPKHHQIESWSRHMPGWRLITPNTTKLKTHTFDFISLPARLRE